MLPTAMSMKPSATCSGERALPVACSISRGERRELRAHDGSVERLVALRPEHLGKERRLDLADGDVRIGDGERPAAPVGRRPRIGARALRPDAKARAVESEDRAAAGGHGVDAIIGARTRTPATWVSKARSNSPA